MRHLAAALCLLSAPAFAQGNPNWIYNQVISAQQWNAQWSTKADVTGGTINNGVLNSVTINGSLGGSPTVGGVWTASNATLSGFTINSGAFGGAIAAAGATITGITLSGGSVAGIVLFPGSGVVCDGVTDDTTAMNAALATLTSGGRGIIASGKRCLINSANLVIPANVILEGAAGPGQTKGIAATVPIAASGILLNSSFTVSLNTAGAGLQHLAIYRSGLISSPSDAQVIAAVAQWGAETSVGITLGASSSGTLINDVLVVGFNTGIHALGGRFSIDNVGIDSYNGIEVGPGIGDVNTIAHTRLEPYYRNASSFTTGVGARPGVAFNLHDGNGGTTISDSFGFLFATGLLGSGASSVYVHDTTFEWHDADGNGIANTDCVRFVGASSQNVVHHVGCNAFDTSFSNESHGLVQFGSTTSQGNGGSAPVSYYLAAAPTANPPTLTLIVGAAGDTITATFTSASITGSPLAIVYTVATGDTATTAAQKLAVRINGAWQLAGTRIQANASAGVVTVQYPTSLTVTVGCAASGTSTCTTGTGTASAGSTTQLISPVVNNTLNPGISVGADSTNGVAIASVTAPYVSTSGLLANWLVAGSASAAKISYSAIPWAAPTAAGNLVCGTSPTFGTASTDAHGSIAEGTSFAGTCTLTFKVPFPVVPQCSVRAVTSSPVTAVTVSTTQLVVTNAAAGTIAYDCDPNGSQGLTSQSPPIPYDQALFQNGNVSGNGADLTEDTLTNCQFSIPAAKLLSVGDRIHIVAGGQFAASTDVKNARVYFGGQVPGQNTSSVLGTTSWHSDIWVTKTGSSAQSYDASNIRSAANPVPLNGTTAQTDTNAILVKVTGQNSTNSVADSITCQSLSVDYVRSQ